MKKFSVWMAVGALLAFWPAAALAQPDPRDSVILESKPVDANVDSTGVGSAFRMKVYITNKDTIAILTLALQESTLLGTGYALLDSMGPSGSTDDGWTLADCLVYLKTKLDNFPAEDFFLYNGASPDRFLLASAFSPTGLNPTRDSEPPNAARSAIWELRFMSTTNGNACVQFDTAAAGTGLAQATGMTILRDNGTFIQDIPVNFRVGQLDVGRQGLCTISGIRDVNPGQRPQSYSLSQNYPNPFNANTQISFALPKPGKTTLEIFNILGQKVNTLLDEYIDKPGYKIVNWDGRDNRGMEVPSGIYFYRLRSQDFLQTKKMLMIQ